MTAGICAVVLGMIALSACGRRPQHWLGMDRPSASCVGHNWNAYRESCVAGGRRYECITEGDGTWRCAEVTGAAQ